MPPRLALSVAGGSTWSHLERIFPRRHSPWNYLWNTQGGAGRVLQESKIKEDLSMSYLSTLCAKAGIAYERTIHDSDSTDATVAKIIKVGKESIRSELRVQLKATSSSSQYHKSDTTITYKLKAKNYNDMCGQATTPIILCLLVLPEDPSEWVHWTQEELMLRGCMYWADFSDQPPTKNESTITVELARQNMLNSEALDGLLRRRAEEVMGYDRAGNVEGSSIQD